MNFPFFNTKELSTGKTYTLTTSAGRREYFSDKLGSKIDEVKEYLEHNSFIGYMLAKKMAGKGTYAKMIEEILGSDRFVHISVGDVVRDVHNMLESDNTGEIRALKDYLASNYRGFMSSDDALYALTSRTQDKVSVPTELILTLLKREIDKVGKKALFIDGLPRSLDQLSYSLYFRDLINYRSDPDFFILIDVPMEVINTRMTGRLICPICKTSRNIVTNPTKFVQYDNSTDEYYLVCDNEKCLGYGKERYVRKEGDDQGIKSIEKRLNDDGELMKMAFNLAGIPKVLIRSSYPVDTSGDYLENFEIQPKFVYSRGENGEVIISEVPWMFKDDDGVESYTVLAATYVVNMFNQIHHILLR